MVQYKEDWVEKKINSNLVFHAVFISSILKKNLNIFILYYQYNILFLIVLFNKYF